MCRHKLLLAVSSGWPLVLYKVLLPLPPDFVGQISDCSLSTDCTVGRASNKTMNYKNSVSNLSDKILFINSIFQNKNIPNNLVHISFFFLLYLIVNF